MNWASNFWKPKQENATKFNPNTVNNPAVVGQMQFSSTVSPNGTTQVTAVKNGMGDATPSQSKEFSPVSDLNESKVTNEVQQAQQEAADTNQQEQPNQQHVPAKTDLNSTQQQPLRAMSPEPQLPIEQQSTAATTAASEKESPATIVGLKSWASSFGKSELRLRSESSTSSEEQEWALPPSDGSIQQTHTKATFDC
ncbi:MAG: hypothetical protein K0Q74_1438 [Gammaproteobacteria bacterium]|nr:hypothetical protein [Gammaproteobacteria bacterium]